MPVRTVYVRLARPPLRLLYVHGTYRRVERGGSEPRALPRYARVVFGRFMQLVILAPLAMLVGGKWLGPRARSTFVLTGVVISVAAGAAYYWFCPDPSDLWGAFYFLILKLPIITVGGTGVLAALIARQRTQMLAAVMAALLGHVVGIIIMFASTAPPVYGFLGYVLDVAPAALYASAAAAIAATAGSRRR